MGFSSMNILINIGVMISLTVANFVITTIFMMFNKIKFRK